MLSENSHWEFRRASAPLWGKTHFLQSSISSGSYALLFPSLNWSLILGRRECSTDVSFLAEHSDASCSLHLDQLEVAVLVVIYCKNETKQDEKRLSWGPMIYYCTQKWVCLLVLIRGFFIKALVSMLVFSVDLCAQWIFALYSLWLWIIRGLSLLWESEPAESLQNLFGVFCLPWTTPDPSSAQTYFPITVHLKDPSCHRCCIK